MMKGLIFILLMGLATLASGQVVDSTFQMELAKLDSIKQAQIDTIKATYLRAFAREFGGPDSDRVLEVLQKRMEQELHAVEIKYGEQFRALIEKHFH